MLKYDLVFVHLVPGDDNSRPFARRQLNEFATRGFRVAHAAPEYQEDEDGSTVVGWELILEKDEEIVLSEQTELASQVARILEQLLQDHELSLNTAQLYRARQVIARGLREASSAGTADSGRPAQG